MPITRMEFRKALRRWEEEYIGEAEHQDDEEYWETFATPDEAVADFALYLSNTDALFPPNIPEDKTSPNEEDK